MAERYHILTLNNISPQGLKRFPGARYTVGPHVPEPDAILVRSHNMLKMEIPASVKAIGRAGAGTNNIPVERMTERGVPVFNTPGANANAVKELVVAGMLMAARNLVPAIRFTEGLMGDETTLHRLIEEGKKQFAGFELPGRTLGVIGLGAIGSLVADAGIKLGMKVVGYDPEITVEAAWSLPSQVRKAHTLEELVRAADFVTVHVPLLDMTRHLVDHKLVHKMKPGAILLNFARDGVVDVEAVLAGLSEHRIKYYVTDFPHPGLVHHPAVIALPHLGASTQEAEDNCAVMVVDQVMDYLENGNIVNSVNFPTVVMARESPYRIGVANMNVPNMVGQISTAMARAGLNIHNMLNKSRGAAAYTLVDLDSPPPPRVIEEIAAIPGVLAVRYLPSGDGHERAD
ncbi:phosphoglycerate dehydrogenase [Pelomicrobium sp. G1]|uniref:phosphoglycerate dehydrogenase n=1 Tax=unclassified Pelomicrobium TaxID=2815318 RepID=UPI0021DE2601|nr:MAG: D-3-phosphoglycerate dehydrogenase [Burkholderiales bacterium]